MNDVKVNDCENEYEMKQQAKVNTGENSTVFPFTDLTREAPDAAVGAKEFSLAGKLVRPVTLPLPTEKQISNKPVIP